MLGPICSRPVFFALYPEVCDRCGHLTTAHQTIEPHNVPDADAYKAALWKILMALGAGVYNRYGYEGAINDHDTLELREHLRSCGMDFDAMKLPSVQHLRDYDDNTVKVLGGRLTCGCGEHKDTQITLPGFVYGQLVWCSLQSEKTGE